MPQATSEEKMIFFSIALMYAFYLTGTLYVVGSLIGWGILCVCLLRAFIEGRWPENAMLSVTGVTWIIGMLIMLLSLLIAHMDYQLGMAQTIKSSIGWAKGWALFALFITLGSVLKINPAIISRACCLLAGQTLLFVPVSLLAFLAGFDGSIYVSPFKAVGGPVSTFEVNLFGMNPETGKPRWSFFAPWAPAAGLISCLYLVVCCQERSTFWRRIGILGTLTMCIFCQSRAGWGLFMGLLPTIFLYRFIRTPGFALLAGVTVSAIILLGQPVIEEVLGIYQQVKDARPDSTRVRSDLADIALQRWASEAPIWGHGIMETGPKSVEFMPIGTHHSWYGLLFIKGAVGLVAFAFPLLITVINLGFTAHQSQLGWSALLITLIIIGYSFFENLEILTYLTWPALLWIGITINPYQQLRGQYA